MRNWQGKDINKINEQNYSKIKEVHVNKYEEGEKKK